MLRTHTETGRSANRVNTVTKIIVVEYGGKEGGKGSAMAKSRNPSHRLCMKNRRVDDRGCA